MPAQQQALYVSGHSYNMKLVTAFSILIFFLAACNQASHNDKPNTSVATVDSSEKDDVAPNLNEVRREFIKSYNQPIEVDTFFVVENKKFKLILKHYCTHDSALIVPAKYNFDTNKDFRTHNFKSDLVLISGDDTVFKKAIDKKLFNKLLNPEEISYGTLLYPNVYLEDDSIGVQYSLSIPATDVGQPVNIKIDTVGNYRVFQ